MKIAIVSGMLPSGHYTQNLASGLSKIKKIKLFIYTDKDKDNLKIKNRGKIKLTWTKSASFVYQIIRQVVLDKPDIVHFQHEINMFGGLLTAMLFPLLLFFAKLTGVGIVTTVHATVSPDQINKHFVETFNKNPQIIRPLYLKIYFSYLYKTICLLSHRVIVHTELSKQVLQEYLPSAKDKIIVIPTTIPHVKMVKAKKKKYFFYFGYIAHRKGLENMIEGFKEFIKENPKSGFNLILAGGVISGQEKALEDLKKTISKNALKNNIKYVGFLNLKQQNQYYREAYAVVIPAKVSISASGPLYHATSHGKFIIASNIGHLRYEIKNNYNGYLISNSGWQKAFQKVIKNPVWVSKIERGTKKTAIERSPLKTAKKYIKLYEQIS